MDKDKVIAILDELADKTDDDYIFDKYMEIKDEISKNNEYSTDDVYDKEGVKWSEKYDNLKKRYRERFYSDIETAIADQEEDNEEDTKVKEFDDLFEDREGDYK